MVGFSVQPLFRTQDLQEHGRRFTILGDNLHRQPHRTKPDGGSKISHPHAALQPSGLRFRPFLNQHNLGGVSPLSMRGLVMHKIGICAASLVLLYRIDAGVVLG